MAVLNAAPAIAARVPAPVFVANNKRRRALVSQIVKASNLPSEAVEHWLKEDVIAVCTGGDPSSKALDERGWASVFTALQEKLDQYEGAPLRDEFESSGHPNALPTGEQKRMIAQLVARLERGEEKAAAVCRRQFRRDRATTRWQASNLIEALKSMVVIELQLFDRAARLDPARLNEQERALQREFGAETKPNRLHVGAVLWMADLCKRHGV